MPENDPNLPKLLINLGIAAWHLPQAAIRQTETHVHREAQLCGLDAGLDIIETQAGSWLCPPGRCVWIPPDVPHSLRSCGKIGGWMLRLQAEMSENLPQKPSVLALTGLLQEVVVRITEWVSEPDSTVAKKRLVAVLKDEIAGASQVSLCLPAPKDTVLKRLAVVMSEDVRRSWNLAALAHEAGLSERSLFRGFQRETGLSPGQWRRQMQILRSLEWLANGGSVTETSLEVGYESVGAFIRAFRQVIGVTPTGYVQRRR